MLVAFEFPPVSHLLEWPDLFAGINKVALIYIAATVITLVLVFLATRNRQLVPRGTQNVTESAIDFIEDSIIAQTMVPTGCLPPVPDHPLLLRALLNIFEVVPFIQFPATSRMAIPPSWPSSSGSSSTSSG